MSFRPDQTKTPYQERVIGWSVTLTSVVVAFVGTPYVVSAVLPHAINFAQIHYGIGFLMPLIVWPTTFAILGFGSATILKPLATQAALRLLMLSR